MSFSGSTEYNNMGQGIGPGGFGGMGFGGMGGFGLIGLLGIGDLLRRDHRHGEDGDGGGCAREAALLAAIANVKDDGRASTLGLAAAIGNAKDVSVQEARGIGAAICDAEKTNLQQFYALAIQNSNDTQAVKDQATAFQVANDNKFDALAAAGVNQTAAILARINDAEVQRLRDELELSRHACRSKEVEISIQNTNTAIATQMQQQQQMQQQAKFEHDRRFDALFGQVAIIGNQVAKSANEIVNVGGLVAASQAANPVNVK
jgi:hypothetical protein